MLLTSLSSALWTKDQQSEKKICYKKQTIVLKQLQPDVILPGKSRETGMGVLSVSPSPTSFAPHAAGNGRAKEAQGLVNKFLSFKIVIFLLYFLLPTLISCGKMILRLSRVSRVTLHGPFKVSAASQSGFWRMASRCLTSSNCGYRFRDEHGTEHGPHSVINNAVRTVSYLLSSRYCIRPEVPRYRSCRWLVQLIDA